MSGVSCKSVTRITPLKAQYMWYFTNRKKASAGAVTVAHRVPCDSEVHIPVRRPSVTFLYKGNAFRDDYLIIQHALEHAQFFLSE